LEEPALEYLGRLLAYEPVMPVFVLDMTEDEYDCPKRPREEVDA
jgi:hypothetical protein